MKRFLVVICSFLCMSVFLFSCKTIGALATVGGVLGEMAGIEGSVEMDIRSNGKSRQMLLNPGEMVQYDRETGDE